MQKPPSGPSPFPPGRQPTPPPAPGARPGAGPPPGYGQPPYSQPAAPAYPPQGQAAPPPYNPPGQPAAPAYSPPPPAPAGGSAVAAYAAANYVRPSTAKGRGFLKFFAGSCIFSAWLTLVICVILTVTSFFSASMLSGAANMLGGAAGGSPGITSPSNFPTGLPAPNGPLGTNGSGMGGGGEDDPFSGIPGMGGGGGGALPGLGGAPQMNPFGGVISQIMGGIIVASGVITLLTGVTMFLFLFGVGKLAYAHLDLQEQTERTQQALQAALAQLNPQRG